MQSLFAYDRCREANIQLALNYLDSRFSPDLNSMETQDKVLLKQQGLAAKQQFLDSIAGKAIPNSDQETVVREEVEKAMANKVQQTSKDLEHFKKGVVSEVQQINRYYHAVLTLLVTFSDLAKEDKKNSLPILANNNIAKALTTNPALQKIQVKENFWAAESNQIQGWYKEIVKADLLNGEFKEVDVIDLEVEKKVMRHISRKLILSSTINDFFAERDIRWSEDHNIIKSLVDKTIKSFDEATGQIQLQQLSLDWEDDLRFMNTLFEKSAATEPRYKELIAKNTKNWEVDRLPLTDRIILEMAIAELISFPSIPIKVTINEYIELTKKYSTPKSPKFINGILDVIAKELQTDGTIKKSGRGLIDNK